jgi:DNA-directed RNA polymerase specialized sigma24 family protein
MDRPPKDRSLSELADSCKNELNHFSRREGYDEQYCLEIFRRAMLQGESLAWELLHKCFKPTMLRWLRSHPHRDAASRLDSEENYIVQAFERFWSSTVHNQQLEFRTLAAALSYLHASLNGAILDTLRTYSRAKEDPLPEPGSPGEPVVEESDDSNVWRIIQHMLPDKRERRLAYLLFHCGFKSREIVQLFPKEFSNVQQIYRLHRHIIERLQRNRDRLQWLLSDEQY